MKGTRYSCQILMKLEFSRQTFEKSSNIKFQESLSRGSRVVASGQTDGRAGMMKLIVASLNFGNAPKKRCGFQQQLLFQSVINYDCIT